MTSGFGLERLGLLALRYPRAVLAVVLAIAAPLLFFASQIGYASDIREIFRSDSPEFVRYQQVLQLYPEGDRDILLVVEGPSLFTPDNLERLRTLHLELSLTDKVRHVLSMFSARRAPDDKGQAVTVFPTDLAAIKDVDGLRLEVQSHPLIAGKLLSQDGQLALFLISLEGQQDVPRLQRIAGEIERLADELLAGSGLRAVLTGPSYLRVEIIGALIRDQAIFSIAGFAIGFALSWMFLSSLTYALIAGAPSFLAPVSLLGLMQIAGQQVTVLTCVVPALVMVLVFADALHLLFGIRRNLAKGESIDAAIEASVRRIGPACVLTTLTTALALLSLVFVSHRFISSFGAIAALGTVLAYVATLTLVPALSRIVLAGRAAGGAWRPGAAEAAIGRICDDIATAVRKWPRQLMAGGVLLAVTAGTLYAMTPPRYEYRQYLPKTSQALHAMSRIDARLGGTEALLVFVQWPPDIAMRTQAVLDRVREVHELLQQSGFVDQVSSLHSAELWLKPAGYDAERIFRFLDDADTALGSRVISLKSRSVLLTGYFPFTDSALLLPRLAALERDLAAYAGKHPGLDLHVTGLGPVSAKAGHAMIRQLNLSLMVAVCLIIVLIGVALRSLRASLVAILPNVLPVAIAGSLLFVTGKGLQFTSVVAFTLGFGIAVDNTIHMLNRFRLSRGDGAATANALEISIRTVGPVLIISTIVLGAGLGGTLLSRMPSMQLFGLMSVVLLSSALAANLLLLPCLIAWAEEWRWASRPQQS